MLQSSLLCHKKFRKDIEETGCEVNPRDPCVANKMTNGKQHAIAWHVDDSKASHVDPKVNDQFIKWLNKKCGAISEATAARGKKHAHLGMTLDFTKDGSAIVDMSDCVKKDMLEEWEGGFLEKSVKTPASENLFKVDPKSKLLSPKLKKEFHTMTAKGPLVAKRARPDIGPTIAFLRTRAQKPTAQDWNKLKRMMTHLRDTQSMVLTLSCDGSSAIKWHIDAAFAVHEDFKSHTGANVAMGHGMIVSSSTKQKMNTRSSAEAELVGFDDIVAKVMWVKMFLQHQGVKIKENVVFQDNMSTIKLAENGLASAGKRSRHLSVRLFFMTDLIKRKEIEVRCCPTEKMASDFMSKPTQGRTHVGFRGEIMGIE